MFVMDVYVYNNLVDLLCETEYRQLLPVPYKLGWLHLYTHSEVVLLYMPVTTHSTVYVHCTSSLSCVTQNKKQCKTFIVS